MLHSQKTLINFFIVIFLSSCKFECNTNGSKKNNPYAAESTVKKVGDVTISNNITITTNTTKLKSATLIFENGDRIPDDNVIGLNEKIKLKLTFADNDAWKIINQKSSLGASEKITADDGTVIVNAGDVFKDETDGIDADKAQIIKLSVVMTKPQVGAKYYMVYFRLWDKYGTAELTGNYKFYLKK